MKIKQGRIMNSSILIVEDNQELNQYLSDFLESNGFVISSLSQGAKVLDEIEEFNPDLVLLDLKLPDLDGKTVCREIKSVYPETKVIILTAKDDTQDVVKGFNIGADDYVTKPFASEELLARIKSRLKETKGDKILQVDDLTLNPQSMQVKRGSHNIDLTQTEYKLFHYLIKNKNQVLSREMILSHVWGYKSDADSRVVDVYVGYLRKKIDKNFEPKLIHSVRGFGYILQDKTKN